MLAAPPEVGALLVDEGVVDAVLPVRGLAPLAPGALVAADAADPEVLGGERVGLAVNLHGRGPQSTAALAALHPEHLAAVAGAGGADGDASAAPAWDDDEQEVLRWCRLVRGLGGACGPDDLVLRDAPPAARTGPVVVHPGAASGSRRWPAERWRAVVTALLADGRDVAVTGSAAEAALCALVAAPGARDLAGTLDLRDLLDLVAASPLLLSGDTGVAHVATAARTPSVLLFGPTPPARWGPAVDPDRHLVLRPGPPGRVGDPHGPVPDASLLLTGVDDVLAAVDALAAARPARR